MTFTAEYTAKHTLVRGIVRAGLNPDDFNLVKRENGKWGADAKVKAPKAAKVARAACDRYKRLTHSTVERPCDIVRAWAFKHPNGTRQQALAALVPQGVDPGTVSVQLNKARHKQQAERFMAALGKVDA